jgi:hypothetical protein
MELTEAKPAETLQENRIQVSNTKKPLFFYVNLAKVRFPGGLTLPVFNTPSVRSLAHQIPVE